MIPTPEKLPRWRGFNLLEKFIAEHQGEYRESDFAWIAELGFNFARLPMSYRCWSCPEDWRTMDEQILKHIDKAVQYGQKHGVHVNLNFHRAPGYCVNPPAEHNNLWNDTEALDAAAYQWSHFARRYKGIPNSELSFDLVNEPAGVDEPDYTRVVRHLTQAIRAEDPDRLIIADGLEWGNKPVPSLKDLRVGQSTRGYFPMQISHYYAGWVKGSDTWEAPTWPLKLGEVVIDKEALRTRAVTPWTELAETGVGVHVGEWGSYHHTPHTVALAWMEDFLSLWQEAGFGWAMWNFRGDFGILDSGRKDVAYEAFRGHQLDRNMLTLIQKY